MSINFNRLKSPLIATIIVSLVVGGLSGWLAATAVLNLNQPEASFWTGMVKKDFFADSVKPEQERKMLLPADNEDAVTIQTVKKAAPAVVSIIVSKDVGKYYNQTGPLFPFEDFFKEFGLPFEFKSEPQPKSESPAPNKQQVGGGTGFIIDSNGLILTNKHVVEDKDAEYTVAVSSGKQYPAKVLAVDPILDVALVKIEASGLATLLLGDSDKLQIGQTVVAIGNVLGQYRNTVTKGVISGINRRVVAGKIGGGSEVIEEAIQTDAAINPGNSGGPLLNLAGEAVGINTAVSREGQLVGFAIPINQAKRLAESVQKYGRVVRPWLGVRYVIINKEIAEKNKLPVDYGAMLVRGAGQTEPAVVPGSPADKAGLLENDIILEIDGVKIDEDHSLAVIIGKKQVGESVKLKVLSKGDAKEAEVKLEEMKQ